MTMRRFIDVGYAILVDNCQRIGKDLLTAITIVDNLGRPPEEQVPEAEKIDNAASMDLLMASMAGVKGAPVR